MRYSVFAGGKRLRPILTLAAGRAGTLGAEELARPAAALELVHTYSLIHDDLPAMDDDELRRGKPTCHVAYGEATAILAGDALLTLAFEVLGRYPEGQAHAERRAQAVVAVALAAGSPGMVGGQVADLESEGMVGATEADLEAVHRRKTGALITAALEVGGILGGVDEAARARLRSYGRALGLAFQVVDDILDVEGDAAVLGKTAGKDAEAGKLTYPAVLGLERARERARDLVDEATRAAGDLGDATELLRGLAGLVLSRRS
jgi:geranylgeranyl diphosphate synthase type II